MHDKRESDETDHDNAFDKQHVISDLSVLIHLHDEFHLFRSYGQAFVIQESESDNGCNHDDDNNRSVIQDELQERNVRCTSQHNVRRVADQCGCTAYVG